MKTTTSFSNRLDNSSGIGQDNSNKAMQSASQTTESPETAKKTPLTPKRFGLFAGLALTGITTMLTTSHIEQAGAWGTIDENDNESSGPSPAALPPPLVVGTKPLLKKGAIQAGKWLIAVLAEYGVHTAIDKIFENTEG